MQDILEKNPENCNHVKVTEICYEKWVTLACQTVLGACMLCVSERGEVQVTSQSL